MALAVATTFWEAVYGRTIIREVDGVKYYELPREGLTEFRLMHQGLPIFAMGTPPGAGRRNLRYRVRTDKCDGGSRFLMGWEPHGPAFLLDPEAIDADRPGLWVADQGFHMQADCRCEAPHPIGWFEPPMPGGTEL